MEKKMTEQTIINGQELNRSTPEQTFNPETGKFTWPRDAAGNKLMFRDWTKVEKQGYYDYRKSGKKSTDNKSAEFDKLTEAVKNAVTDPVQLAAILKTIEELKPHKKDSVLERLTGCTDPADVKPAYTMVSLMYRGPNLERLSEKATLMSAVEEYGEDLTCVLTKAQVEADIKKLAERNITIKILESAKKVQK